MLDMIFLASAVLGGTVMVCQFLLTLLGMGDDGSDLGGDDFSGDADLGGGDLDAGDFDAGNVDGTGGDLAGDHHTTLSQAADGEIQHTNSSWLFGVLSFRTLVAALAFFGLSGKAALSAEMAPVAALVAATAVGLGAMIGMYWLMRSISRLNSSGNQRIGNALGKPATVYVSIPAGGEGAGKVQLTMQNRIVEYQAVTTEEEPLKSGEPVEVVDILNHNTLQVRRVEATV
jgi:hypothetical protein